MENRIKNLLDSLFRKKLNEDSSAPDELLWKEIEGRLASRKRKRRGLFLLFFFLLAVSGSVLIVSKHRTSYITSSRTTEEKNSRPLSSANSPSESEGVSAAKIDSTNVQTKMTFGKREKNSRSLSTLNIGKQNDFSSQPQKAHSAKESPHQAATTVETESSQKSSGSKSVLQNQKSAYENNQNDNESIAQNKNEVTSGKEEELNVAASGIIPSGVDSIDKNSLQIKSDSSTNLSGIKTSELQSDSSLHQENNLALLSDESTSNSKKEIRWFADVFLTYSIDSRNFSVGGKTDSLYSVRRNNEEKMLNTFNYGFHFGMERNHLQLMSGLSLIHYAEDIEYANRSNCYFVKNTGGYYNADSVYIYTYDSTIVEVENDSMSIHNGKQVSSWLEVPLIASYKIPLSHFAIHLGGGFTALFPVNWNAYYLNQTVTGLENPSVIKMIQPVVMNLQLNAGVEIPLSKNLHALLDLRYKRNLSSIFKSNYFLDQKYQSLGVQLSLRYMFGR